MSKNECQSELIIVRSYIKKYIPAHDMFGRIIIVNDGELIYGTKINILWPDVLQAFPSGF